MRIDQTFVRLGAGAFVVAAFAAAVVGQTTMRVSVSSAGAQGNGASGSELFLKPATAVSSDGRYIAFSSEANNLVSGDTNLVRDVFLRDRQSGTTVRVSVDALANQADDESNNVAISPDARYVAFDSTATNLVAGDTNGGLDVFVLDRQSGTLERVSLDSTGAQADFGGGRPAITPDGRFVTFASFATNLVAGDTNGETDIFVKDRQTGSVERVSVDSSGSESDDQSLAPAISADGRFVVFVSGATNLVAGDTNNQIDCFVRDRTSGTTERVSVSSAGVQGLGFLEWYGTISADGRYVVFQSRSSNLVPGDTNATTDIFLRDRVAGTTERVNLSTGGAEANGYSSTAEISADGRYVAFTTVASNLVPGDTNGVGDVYLRDLVAGVTERVSVSATGSQGTANCEDAVVSEDGRYVAFTGRASELVPADTNGVDDFFLRDRQGGSNFTPLCHPGTAGVITCPCANPPSDSDRGCDNSSGTGGAMLSASGATSLSSDSLVFTTAGEKPLALSIVAQWTGTNAGGVIFGMGVRCTSGALKRLFTKSAVSGSITAPNFGAGDLQVSVRSAALGDTILAGQSRWYLVYYRDPIVLGGCPAIATFNATQTGAVLWAP